MSVEANYKVECHVVETFETSIAGLDPGDKKVTHSVFNSQARLNADTAVPATKVASFEVTMTGAAVDVQFDSLTGVNGVAVDGTGLKVQIIKIRNAGAVAMTIAPKAATDNYDLLGASFTLILLAGQEITFYGNEATPEIGAGEAITITGTSADKAEVIVVMG